MMIRTLYDITWKIKNDSVAKWVYKINKLLVNIFYPIFVKNCYGVNEASNIIVSLTSYPARMNTLHLTVRSLLNQTIKPRKIILWLAEDQFPNREADLPAKILEQQKFGLEICFCDNLYPHKKYYYSMLQNPTMDVITVDDDVFYPENLIEDLMTLSQKFPGTVCCTMGHQFVLDDEGDVYSKDADWHLQNGVCEPMFSLIPTGVGGVYYPAGCLSKEVFSKEKIKECCLTSDDLWLKAMATLNRVKAVRVNRKTKIFFSILITQKNGLYKSNVYENRNEIAWQKIMEAYPECRTILISEVSKEMSEASKI